MQGLVGSGSRLLPWKPASPEAAGPLQSRRALGLDLGLARGPSFLACSWMDGEAGWQALQGPERSRNGPFQGFQSLYTRQSSGLQSCIASSVLRPLQAPERPLRPVAEHGQETPLQKSNLPSLPRSPQLPGDWSSVASRRAWLRSGLACRLRRVAHSV